MSCTFHLRLLFKGIILILRKMTSNFFNAVLTKFHYNHYTQNGVFLSVNVTKSKFLADLNACTKEIFNGFFCVGND